MHQKLESMMKEKAIERVGRKPIPKGTKLKIWMSSGGRCQYEGCNKPLWKDELTQKIMMKGYMSHIIAASSGGPRGDELLSPELQIEYENLMLLCDECHIRIDKAQVQEHTPEYLYAMKKAQEERIEMLTGLKKEQKTHLILYGGRIGEQKASITFSEAINAILYDRYPSSDKPIELGIPKCEIEDHLPEYWEFQEKHLIMAFNKNVKPYLDNDKIQHYSIFALAPQPLLIRLGTLIPDIYPAKVFQKLREPLTWKWQESAPKNSIKIIEPNISNKTPALIIGLSATVTNDRIHQVLGDDVSIWRITVVNPHNNFLRSRTQLSEIRTVFRHVLDKIKAQHGDGEPLHVFPVMPVSAAVEFGRVRMPKADMSLVIYDQNHQKNGFFKTLTIS